MTVSPGAPFGVTPQVDLNPMHWLGDAAQEGVADGFTAMMMSLWSAALWLLQSVFGLLDQFTTPRLDDPGLSHLYGVTASISLAVALIVAFGQLGVAAIRRDGRSMATLLVGLGQYGAVLTVWVGVCAALVLGAAGLTQTLLQQLLEVDSFSGYAAGAGWVDNVTGTVEAAVLGLCALFMLIPAALGYLFIMLAREAAILVLVTTMPIAAAGALGESTRTWMWKSIRWFLAACLTSPLLALVLGLGVQIGHAAFPESDAATIQRMDVQGTPAGATGMAGPTAAADEVAGDDGVPDTAANVGLAVVGCVIMLVGCFCPLALFRLLAFVDPGTGSGAAFRATLAANGGVAGILSSSRSAPASATSGASAQTGDDLGRSASESSAEAETTARFATRLARGVPAAGRAIGGTVGALGGVAAQGASLGVDVMGQAGVGHQGYFDTTPSNRSRPTRDRTGHPGVPELPDTPRVGAEADDLLPGAAHDPQSPRIPETQSSGAPAAAGPSVEDAAMLA